MPRNTKVAKGQSSGEDAKLLRQKKRFVKARKALAKTYTKYKDEKMEREVEGGHQLVMKEIDAILRHVEAWKWLQGKPGVPACFEQKCELILDAAKKLSYELSKCDDINAEQDERYEMIVVHVAALDIDGYTANDKFAVEWAKEVESMNRDWQTIPPLMVGRRRYLLDAWNVLHTKFDGCGCRVCMLEYTRMAPNALALNFRGQTPEPASGPELSEESSGNGEEPTKDL